METDIVSTRLPAFKIHWWWLATEKPVPRITVPLGDFIELYITEGQDERIDGEIALCQAIHETGWFQYPGDVQPHQNNYAGIGATGGGEPGNSFPSARIGVRAHIQHLKAYADPNITEAELVHPCVDPRFKYVTKGSAKTWESLGGKWAVPGFGYGERILAIHRRMKDGV
jgi:hypothetical protein